MPTYEYGCDSCGHQFSVEQRISEEPLKTCPKCRKRKIKRLIVSGNFLLKGGGWYKDGYASSSGAASPKTPSGTGEEKKGGCPKAKDSPACSTCPGNNS